MKRSEMIKIISEHISDNVPYYYKNGVTFPDHEADLLLTKLEKSGMLPPDRYSNFFVPEVEIKPVYKWDQE